MKIAVDADDVLVDFTPGIMNAFETDFGERLRYDGDPWGMSISSLYHHPKLVSAGYADWLEWLRDRDWLWGGTFGAVPGAIGGIATLRNQGHYVELVTAKPRWGEAQMFRWLGKWRPPVNAVTFVDEAKYKTDITDADIIVDDNLETCEDFAATGRRALLFRQSGFSGARSSSVEWARNWQQVISAVARIERGVAVS